MDNLETPNETVEKPKYRSPTPVNSSDFHRGRERNGVNRLRLGLCQRPEQVDLADIVYQSEPRTSPLYIHFPFGTEGQAMHPFLHTDVGKDRFHDPEPSDINALALFTIDPRLHFIDQVGLLALHLNGQIATRCIRLTQTARSQCTGSTVFDACMVDIIASITVGLVAGTTFQNLALRT
jgi:hypothetical protein